MLACPCDFRDWGGSIVEKCGHTTTGWQTVERSSGNATGTGGGEYRIILVVDNKEKTYVL